MPARLLRPRAPSRLWVPTVAALAGAAVLGRSGAAQQPAQQPAAAPARPTGPAPAAPDPAAPTPVAPTPTPPAADTAPSSATAPVPAGGRRTTAPVPTAPRGANAPAPAALAPRAPAPVFTRERLLEIPTLPVAGGSPAAVLHVQVLLDAAGFSPGMLDGRWGENMRLALTAYREAAGLPAVDGDVVDETTYRRLTADANGRPAVTTYPVSAGDVRGPYRPVPGSIEEKSKADCLCYESLLERLSERFHVRQPVLRALNPGVDFAALRAGDEITVPNTWRLPPGRRVTRVLVDKDEGALRGLDAGGATVFWLPATVGSGDMPSPHGLLRVQAVERNPVYRWDPAVLGDVSRNAPVRYLPGGPNNLVGLVWVALSRPHVGIHGTPTPETVGYAASHGCVRLTNWDAVWFSGVARAGLPVEFR